MRLEHCVDNFISNIKGQPTALYLLTNSKGSVAAFTNFGARWVGLELQIGNGLLDPVCGFDSLEPYRGPGDAYYGAIVGRYANRIREGKFSINGKDYQLPVNNGLNHLHGGPNGLHQVVWNVISYSHTALHLAYLSPDGESGYPGEVKVEVIYSLTDNDEVEIAIKAISSQPTIINITSHAYFNLEERGSIDDHLISINADEFLPVNESLIPSEGKKEVYGPFNLLTPKRIGDALSMKDVQLEKGRGFDHCFVLRGEGRRAVAAAECKGLRMECITDQPGLQFYSGNFMSGMNKFRSGSPDNFRNGFCFETQKFPDSPNNPDFPSTIVNPGEVYKHFTSYRFTCL